MSEPRWLKVAETDTLRPGDVKQLKVLARSVAVFNVEGNYWAIDGLCRHMRAELALGKIHGSSVTCHRHGWQYDVTDGRCLTAGKEWATLRTYDVKVENDNIYVDVAPIYRGIAQGQTG